MQMKVKTHANKHKRTFSQQYSRDALAKLTFWLHAITNRVQGLHKLVAVSLIGSAEINEKQVIKAHKL